MGHSFDKRGADERKAADKGIGAMLVEIGCGLAVLLVLLAVALLCGALILKYGMEWFT